MYGLTFTSGGAGDGGDVAAGWHSCHQARDHRWKRGFKKVSVKPLDTFVETYRTPAVFVVTKSGILDKTRPTITKPNRAEWSKLNIGLFNVENCKDGPKWTKYGVTRVL